LVNDQHAGQAAQNTNSKRVTDERGDTTLDIGQPDDPEGAEQ